MTATFYTGLHHAGDLEKDEVEGLPVCVTRSSLKDRVSIPKARGPVLFDSASGFTELQRNGGYDFTPEAHVAFVRRVVEGLGRMPDAIATMDAMCEPWVIYGGWHKGRYFHGTRKWRGMPPDGPDEDFESAVFKHLWWTITNYKKLVRLAPDLPWLVPLQGYHLHQYELCADMYEAAGVDLKAQPLIGLGSVCRREDTDEIEEIVAVMAARGYRLHGFGVKTDGLARYGLDLVSADSMAWSFGARKQGILLPGHEGRHKNCANCLEYALQWREGVLDKLANARHASPWVRPSLFAHLGEAS